MCSEQSNKSGNRIVVLCGPELLHLNTCATLIESGLNVVGICIANQKTAGIPLQYLLKSAKRKGLWPTVSRILSRMLYLAVNARQDRVAYTRLFNQKKIEEVLRPAAGRVHHTANYSSPETMAWLERQQPDVFVVHTPYWITKKVRELPRKRIVLGGHPGLTPQYRGAHSAFWAVYGNKPEDVGCTVFLLSEGVDSGEIVAQERIPVVKGDSFRSLAWKGMIRIAELQAKALRDSGPWPRIVYDQGDCASRIGIR